MQGKKQGTIWPFSSSCGSLPILLCFHQKVVSTTILEHCSRRIQGKPPFSASQQSAGLYRHIQQHIQFKVSIYTSDQSWMECMSIIVFPLLPSFVLSPGKGTSQDQCQKRQVLIPREVSHALRHEPYGLSERGKTETGVSIHVWFSSLGAWCFSEDERSRQGKENIYLNTKNICIQSL